jgi:hypothetical protein
MCIVSKARLGYGSNTGDTASPMGYTLLSEIAIINFADYTVAEVHVTHLLSPNTSEESIPGLLKPGTIELTGNYTADASQQNIDVLAVAQTVFPWKITAPASGALVLTITGYNSSSRRLIHPAARQVDPPYGYVRPYTANKCRWHP